MIKKGFFLAVMMGIFWALLSGCDETAYSPDLYAADANARATQAAVKARLDATQEAREGSEWQATQDAALTQDAHQVEIERISAQGTATAEMLANQKELLAAQMTATIAAWQQQATATQQMMAWQQTQPAATATAGALAAAMRREQDTQALRTWSGWAMLVILVLLMLILFFVFLVQVLPWALVRLFGVVSWSGKPILIAPIQGGVGMIDYTRALGPGTTLDRESGQVTIYGHEDNLLQSQAAARAQAAELLLAAGPGLGRGKVLAQANRIKDESGGAKDVEIPLPSPPGWDWMRRWPGRSLLLGMGAQGPIAADPEAAPHLLIAGTTGSGKTRYGLRPLIAAALAGGWQAAIFDRSGLDYLVFREHPGARLVILEEGEQAIWYLRAMYAEIRRRFEEMTAEGASSWSRWEGRGPRILGAFDEFGNLADSLAPKEREELWRWARMVAAEGRKAGVHLALALQDPTHKSIDLRIRRNMSALAFRVRDGDASRVVLNAGGAEGLGLRQFMATLGGGLVRGVAFAPSDEEIEGLLGERGVRSSVLDVGWMEIETGAEGIEDKDEEIRRLATEGLSMNEIQRRVYGYAGGAAFAAVRAALGDAN